MLLTFLKNSLISFLSWILFFFLNMSNGDNKMMKSYLFEARNLKIIPWNRQVWLEGETISKNGNV